MPSTWLELQADLRAGARSFPSGVRAGCGTGRRTAVPDVNLGLPSLSGVAGDVNSFLGNVQGQIDQFGSEVMGVLQDIGAWIPPELQGAAQSEGQAAEAAKVADITKLETEVRAGGNIVESKGWNENTGQSFYQLKMSGGSGMAFDTDGSIRFNAAPDPPDSPIAGDFQIARCNSFLMNVEESCIIAIHNKSNIMGGPEGADALGNVSGAGASGIKKSLSILVNGGDVDLEVTGGDVKVRSSGNISLDAGKTLELRGADIRLFAGGAPENTGTPSSTTATGEEYGGMIDMRCGIHRVNASSKQHKNSAEYKSIQGEFTIAMEDPLSKFNIVSAGHLCFDANGDILEESRSKATVVGRTPKAGIPTIPVLGSLLQQNAQYTVVNDLPNIPSVPTGSTEVPTATPMMQVVNGDGGLGGFKVSLKRGDMVFSTLQGNILIGNEKMFFGDVLIPNMDRVIAKSIVTNAVMPGSYFVTDSPFLAISGKTTAYMTAGVFTPSPRPVLNSMVLTPARLDINSQDLNTRVEGNAINTFSGTVTTSIQGRNILNITGSNTTNVTGANVRNITGFVTDKSDAGVKIVSPGFVNITAASTINMEAAGAITISTGTTVRITGTAGIYLN